MKKLAGEIKTLETAVDSPAKDNRDKCKSLQERRNAIAKQMQLLGKNMQDGQQALNGLHQTIEANLQLLAAHAETWEWKDALSPTLPSE